MIKETILIALITFLGYSEWLLGTSLIQRPIILGPLVGIALGDLQAGIIMGATLELAMMGFVSIGAYIPPDMVAGTIIGVSLAIKSGAPASTALTLGIPVATVMLAMTTGLGEPLLLMFIHKMDKDAAAADCKRFTRDMFIGGYMQNWCGIIFVPLAFYFGSEWVTDLLDFIPDFVQTGMEIATGLLPALGFALLFQMIARKENIPFFFLGFFIVAYSGLSTTAISIFAIILVALLLGLDKAGIFAGSRPAVSTNEEGDFDDF